MATITCYAGESNAASGLTQQTSVTVNHVIAITSSATINFGTVPDSTLSPTSLTAKNTLTAKSNMPIDVYTRANDTKMINTDPSATDVISPIQFTTHDGSVTNYLTKYQMVYSNWPKPAQGGSTTTWDEVLSIVVPSYTRNGTYVVTIYHAAVPHGAAPPTTP